MKTKLSLLSIPYVVWMALFVVAPIVMVVIYAFTSTSGGFTLDNFSNMGTYAVVFGRSFKLALIATLICLLIGYPVSYMMSKEGPGFQRIAMVLIMLPMWINFLLRTYSWMSILENNGLLNRLFQKIGLIALYNSVTGANIEFFQLLNTQGKPAVHTSYQYSWLSREVDPDGRVLSIKYFDTDGNPALYANQYAEARFTYDLAGRETSVRYYDRAGNLCLCQRGYAVKTTAYNELGNVVEEAYFDTEENPVNTTMGYARAVYAYDELGNLTSERYLDEKAMNIEPLDARYAYALMDYDEAGHVISEEYYDIYDKPAVNRSGFAAHYATYNENGHIVEERYLDAMGQPVASEDGYSSRELVSEDADAGTYTMREVYESAEDESASTYTLQTYDRYDRAIETHYFSSDDKPIDGPEGCAAVEREYTSRGDVSLVRYFDGEGNGVRVNGVYGLSKQYNSYANLELETWLDANGEASANDDGYAAVRYDYDLSNALREERYYQYYLNVDGEPTAATNGAWGMTTLYYPTTRVHVVTYIDQNGDPVVTTNGYAIREYEEDEKGNCTWEGYFDEIHAQINCADGYSSVERSFDSEGRMVSERYLDRYNKLTNNAEGVAGWNGYYDEDGQLVINNRYDQDRNALPADGE